MNYLLVILVTLILDFSSPHSLRQVKSNRTKRRVSNEKRIVCYYANFASMRKGKYKILPDDIDPNLCTHLIYAFANIKEDIGLVPPDTKSGTEQDVFTSLVNLKKINPVLRVMLSVGGSNDGKVSFSYIVTKPELRRVFVESVRPLLIKFGFDGLDLVWLYPGYSQGSLPTDKENYVHLVKEIRDKFKDDFLLSMVVPKTDKLIQVGYDLPELTKYLDFLNIATYGYHDAREPLVNHIAPLYRFDNDQELSPDLNVDATIMTYLKYEVDPAKITMAIPLYGATYTLDDPTKMDIGSNTAGHSGRGTLNYNVICDKITKEMWIVKHVNKSAVGPYAYRDNRWIGYDDEDMVRTKARYAAEKMLGGLMFWSIDKDDVKASCGSKTFPLIKAGKEVFLENNIVLTKNPSSAYSQTIPSSIIFPTLTALTNPLVKDPPRIESTTITEVPQVLNSKNTCLQNKKSPLSLDQSELKENKNFNTNQVTLFFKKITVYITNNNYYSKPNL